MSDLLTKAKALAALEAGVIPKTTYGLGYHTVRFEERNPRRALPQEVVVGEEYVSHMDALAAAADALGLTPDPLLSGGLTDEEIKAVSVVLALLTRLQQRGG